MKVLPYFRWYPADAETDEFYLTLDSAEFKLYHRCLNLSWMNNGVPADLEVLAILARMPREEFDRAWLKVRQRFVVSASDPARLVNPRLEEERQYAVSKSVKAAEAVAERERRRIGRSSDDHPRARARADSVSVSAVVLEGGSGGKPELVPRPPYATDDRFMAFMGEVALTDSPLIEADYADAYTAWLLLDLPTRAKAFQNFSAKRAAGVFADPQMVMRPVRWLKRGEYNRAIPVAKRKMNVAESVEEIVKRRIANGRPPL